MKILNKIQKELKAPKGQFNSFSNFNYRSCEDILEAVKPLLEEATLTIQDEIVQIGDRHYVKATVTLSEPSGASTSVSAYAREALEKKGMDSAQITGATSSYARKYALNGLFLIDDSKDSDSTDNREVEKKKAETTPGKKPTIKMTPEVAKANAKIAIENCNNVWNLADVEKNITNSKNLSAEDKTELLKISKERRMEFDPTEEDGPSYEEINTDK